MSQIDIIGVIDGAEGWHVNIPEAMMTPELEPYRVTPTEPARIYAGDEPPYPVTAFLRFADEAEAVELLGVWTAC